MNEKDFKLTRQLMMEVGLDVQQGGRIIDQDTGSVLQYQDKFFIAPGFSVREEYEISFDPINNIKQMATIFSYFNNKLSEEGSDNVRVFCDGNMSKEQSKYGYMIATTYDNRYIESKMYENGCLSYLDIIIQLNGQEYVDLTEYDKPINSILPKKGKN